MTSAQRERVKELLVHVLEQPSETRAEYLEAFCSDDTTVRAEVVRLLTLREEMGGFLERPAVAVPGDLSPHEIVGRVLRDRYSLQAYIGSGGFADVYRARDVLLERPVAIKILRHGVLSEVTRRQELKALATIEHPGVV